MSIFFMLKSVKFLTDSLIYIQSIFSNRIHAQNFSDIAKLSFSWAEIALFPIQEGLPARPKKFILANLNHQESSNLVAGYSVTTLVVWNIKYIYIKSFLRFFRLFFKYF